MTIAFQNEPLWGESTFNLFPAVFLFSESKKIRLCLRLELAFFPSQCSSCSLLSHHSYAVQLLSNQPKHYTVWQHELLFVTPGEGCATHGTYMSFLQFPSTAVYDSQGKTEALMRESFMYSPHNDSAQKYFPPLTFLNPEAQHTWGFRCKLRHHHYHKCDLFFYSKISQNFCLMRFLKHVMMTNIRTGFKQIPHWSEPIGQQCINMSTRAAYH